MRQNNAVQSHAQAIIQTGGAASCFHIKFDIETSFIIQSTGNKG